MSHKRNQNQHMDGYYTTERINTEAITATLEDIIDYQHKTEYDYKR